MKQIFWMFFTLGPFLYAQEQFPLSGKVLDQSNQPIPIGDVLLFDVDKENLVKYTTLAKGLFDFKEVPQETYWLEVSVLGFEKYTEKITVDKKLELSIQLKEEATQLTGVEVVASKNPISVKNGNLKIDVQNPVFSSMVDPLEVLSKLPNIQISADRESISVIAKGTPLIYLENQRISFEEFTALSVESIESIELINNPSPKYEAEGRAVILVHQKKNMAKGVALTIGETASFKQNFNNYLSSNGSYSNGKWNFRGNLNYNDLGHWESHTFEFRIPTENIYSDYLVLVPNSVRKQVQSGFGFYYPFDEDDYLSFNTLIKLQSDKGPIRTNTFLQNETGQDWIFTESDNVNIRNYYSGNFNFNKKLSERLNLFTGIQFSTFKQNLDTELSNNTNNIGLVLDQIRNQDYDISSWAVRMDFGHNISDTFKSEFGASWNRAKAKAFTSIRQPMVQNETITRYDYHEDLHAAYLNLIPDLGPDLDFNIGTRVEFNQVEGKLDNEAEPLIDRKNTRIFPKAGLTLKIDSTKTISLNYAKNINRPNFSRTSTITVFINPFLEATNNLNLLPTITEEVSTNVQVKNKSLYAGYYKNKNPSNYTISYEEMDTTAIFSPVNLDRESGFYIGMTLPFSHESWTSTNSISLTYNKMMDSTAALSKAKPYFYAYTNQQLKIAKDTIVSFGGWLLTERQEGIFKRNGLVVLNAGINQTFFGKLHCAVRLNDITKAMNFDESYSINGVEANGTYFADAREVALSVKYSFGNNQSAKFKNKDVDENLDRIN